MMREDLLGQHPNHCCIPRPQKRGAEVVLVGPTGAPGVRAGCAGFLGDPKVTGMMARTSISTEYLFHA